MPDEINPTALAAQKAMVTQYHRAEIQDVLDAGPHPDETWFRLQVSGKAESKHLNVTADQLTAIRDIVAGDDDET